MMTRMFSFCACAGLLLSLAGPALAGPNEGGTLILHANPSLTFTSDISDYCGMAGLDSCSNAVTSVPWEPGKKIVFHAMAAFPPGSSPRLKGLSFGISYDPAKFILAARGSCAEFELPDGAWPDSGSGTAQTWTTETQTGLLTECYWFCGYAYAEDEEAPDSTTVELIPHPLHGGKFIDDSFPAEEDSVAAYGRLGFGTAGAVPCPSGEGSVAWILDEPISGNSEEPGEPGGESDDPGTPPDTDGTEGPLPNASEFLSISIAPGQIDVGPDPYRELAVQDIGSTALREALAGVGAISLRRSCPSATLNDLTGHDAEGRIFPLADLTRFYRVRFQDPEAAVQAVGPLHGLSVFGTPSVVPRFELPVSAVPNDSLFDQYETWIAADAQWFLRNDGLRGPDLHDWGCRSALSTYDVRAEDAWSILPSYGDSTVVVGLIDTGIRGGTYESPAVFHRDLRVIPLTQAQRTLIQQHPTEDWCFKHGTVMSGVAAAKTDNLSGVAGLCGNCSLLDIENAGCLLPNCQSRTDTLCASLSHLAWPDHACAAADLTLPYGAKLAAMLISAAGCGTDGTNYYLPDDVANLWHVFAAHNIALIAPSGDYCHTRPYTCAPANIPFVFGVGGFTWDGRFWDGATSCYGTNRGSTVGWSEYPLRTASFIAVTAPASGTIVSTGPGTTNEYDWTRGECSTAAASVAGAVGLLQSLSKSVSGAETDVEDVLGLLRATARSFRKAPTDSATCPVDSCPPELYASGMMDVGAAAYTLMQKHVWHQVYFDEHVVTEDSYGWQFDPVATFVDTSGVMDTTWVQYRASATVSLTPRSEEPDGRDMPHYLAWARKKSANSLPAYPRRMLDRVQLARLGVRDCYLYLIDTGGQARITGYTYAWRIGAGSLHFLIPEDQMRLTYCNVRGQIISVDDTARSKDFLIRVTPNPAPSRTSLFLPGRRPRDLRLEVFDAGGRLVRSLATAQILATGRLDWDCRDGSGRALPSGAYWIRAAFGGGTTTTRVIAVR